MNEITLFILIVIFVFALILLIHLYDRKLVKQIKLYEKRLEAKGVYKRHFIKKSK